MLHLKVKPHPLQSHPTKPGVLFGVSLIFLLIALLVAAVMFAPAKFQRGWGTVLVGSYLVTWGFMLLAAYYQSHTNFFLRGLLWACSAFQALVVRRWRFFGLHVRFWLVARLSCPG